MKLKLTLSTIIATAIFTQVGCAQTPPDPICRGTIDSPCLVQDKSDNGIPKNYRDTTMIKAAYQGNIQGLDTLWLSGSAAVSAKDFQTIATSIKKVAGPHLKEIIDLDLRQESHGYLNGAPITLTADNDWINIGKSHSDVVHDEKAWLSTLKQLPVLHHVLSSSEFKQQLFNSGNDVKVDSIESEQTVATHAGFTYLRLTVTDHLAPTAEDVNRFSHLIQNLPKNTWLHIHCRGGKGRTTTFLVMYDMYQNADKASFNDIIERQASVDPFYDLYNVDDSDPLQVRDFQDRLTMLKQFYEYSRHVKNGYKVDWTTWLHQNHVIYPIRNVILPRP